VGGLQAKILLRKLYRNLLRAEPLLGLPSPVYQPAEEQAPLDPNVSNTVDVATAAAAAEDEAQRRVDEAVDIVAEMELTAEELRVRRFCRYILPSALLETRPIRVAAPAVRARDADAVPRHASMLRSWACARSRRARCR
jgi:hypothetical protein